MSKTLTYVIMGKDQLTPVLQKAGKEGEATGGKLSTAMGAAGQAFSVLAAVGVGGVIKSLNDARNLNLAPLKQAAVDAGIAWSGFKPKVDAAGQAMSKLGFTQSQTNTALKVLVTATGSSTAALSALAGAADYARYKNVSLSDASAALTKAASGNTRALKDLGISTADLPKHFASTGTEASRLGVIMDVLNPKIGGQAASAANTLGGKMNVLKAQTTNFSAQLGTALIPMLSGLMTRLTAVLSPIMQNKAAFVTLGIGISAFAVIARIAMAAFATSAKAALVTSVVGIAILALSIAITELILHWHAVFDAMKTALNVFRDVCVTGLKAVVDYFLWFAGMFINTAAKAFGWIPGLGGKLRDAATAFNTFRDNVNNSLDGLKSKTVNVSVAMTAAANPYAGGISGRAAYGSYIRGPGGPTSDTAGLFALSDGEYVVRASSVSKYGVGFMDALNAGRMAAGGGVNLQAAFPAAGTIDSTVFSAVTKLVKSSWQSVMGSAGFGTGGSGGSGVQKWAGLVMQVLGMLGQSPMWLSTVLRRMNQESGGNQFAVNNWDSNAMAGHPSMGLMQTIPGTFNAYAGPFAGLGIFNPLANIYAGMNYAIHQYGSLAGMNRAGGYDNGGWLMPGATMAYNGTGQPERVLPPGGGLGGSLTVVVNVGTTLASKQEIGRVVSDALTDFGNRGGRVPYARR